MFSMWRVASSVDTGWTNTLGLVINLTNPIDIALGTPTRSVPFNSPSYHRFAGS